MKILIIFDLFISLIGLKENRRIGVHVLRRQSVGGFWLQRHLMGVVFHDSFRFKSTFVTFLETNFSLKEFNLLKICQKNRLEKTFNN